MKKNHIKRKFREDDITESEEIESVKNVPKQNTNTNTLPDIDTNAIETQSIHNDPIDIDLNSQYSNTEDLSDTKLDTKNINSDKFLINTENLFSSSNLKSNDNIHNSSDIFSEISSRNIQSSSFHKYPDFDDNIKNSSLILNFDVTLSYSENSFNDHSNSDDSIQISDYIHKISCTSPESQISIRYSQTPNISTTDIKNNLDNQQQLQIL